MSARLLHPLKPVYALVLTLALSVTVYALTAVLQPVRVYASGSVVSDPGNPLYPNDTTHSMTVNGVSIPIKAEIVDGTTYDVAKFTFSGTADIQVDVPGGIGSYTLWPKSLNLPVTKSGNSLSFSIDNPANLMLEVGGPEQAIHLRHAAGNECTLPGRSECRLLWAGYSRRRRHSAAKRPNAVSGARSASERPCGRNRRQQCENCRPGNSRFERLHEPHREDVRDLFSE